VFLQAGLQAESPTPWTCVAGIGRGHALVNGQCLMVNAELLMVNYLSTNKQINKYTKKIKNE